MDLEQATLPTTTAENLEDTLHGTLTPVGWVPPDDRALTYREWEQTGRVITAIYNATKFARGDWLLYGEGRGDWGQTYTQAIDESGLDIQTLQNEVWVAGAVETSRRRENLSWSHHQEIASLDPEQGDRWLDKAEKKKLRSKDLRQAIQAERIEREGVSAAEAHAFFARLSRECSALIDAAGSMGGVKRLAGGLTREDRLAYASALGRISDEFGDWAEVLVES